MADLVRPAPAIHPENEAFWQGLKHHELRLQVCSSCGTPRFPVAPVCFECFSDGFEWQPMSGRGRLVSAVTVHRATGNTYWGTRVPFSVGIVLLDEGPQMTVAVAERLTPGAPVMADFVDGGDVTYLEFRAA